MSTERRRVVAVVGDARLKDDGRRERLVRLGALLVGAGYRIITGGLGGVMAAVSEGARTSDAWFEGSVIGAVPSYKSSSANEWCDIVIPTGMQIARNIIVVSSADVVIAEGGGAGTMGEIAVAWQLEKPIIALGSEGWASECGDRVLDRRRDEPVHACNTVDEVMATVNEILSAQRTAGREPGEIGDGSRNRDE